MSSNTIASAPRCCGQNSGSGRRNVARRAVDGRGGLLTIGTTAIGTRRLRRGLVRRGGAACRRSPSLPASRAAELARRAERDGLVLAVVHNFQFSHGAGSCSACSRPAGSAPWRPSTGSSSRPAAPAPPLVPGSRRGPLPRQAPHLLYLLRRVLADLEPRMVDARLPNEIRDLSATFAHDEIWAKPDDELQRLRVQWTSWPSARKRSSRWMSSATCSSSSRTTTAHGARRPCGARQRCSAATSRASRHRSLRMARRRSCT